MGLSKLGMKAQDLEVKKRVKRALRQLPGANSSNRSMMAHRQGGAGEPRKRLVMFF